MTVESATHLGGGLVRYTYAGVLPEGVVEISRVDGAVLDQAGNATAAGTDSFMLDSQPPVGSLASPAPAATIVSDPGYVDVQWGDDGLAGLDTTSMDAGDVTVTDVTIERAEHLGDGLVRYWYGENGQTLPAGEIQVQLVAGAVRDQAGNENLAGQAGFVFAATGSISGFVYVDVNNNGIKDPVEMSLPNVPIAVDGAVTRTVVTDADGCYLFDQLPPGNYSIRQLQPTAFIDGVETQGSPATGQMANDWFQEVLLEPNMQLEGYNFGELGLRAELVSKLFFLASSPPLSQEITQYLTLTGDDSWFAFRASYDALMTTEVAGEPADARIELYTSAMLPVALTHGTWEQTVTIFEDQQYVLHIGGIESEMSATIRLTNPGPPGAFHNSDNPLDVNRDQHVSPIDVLTVINQLNHGGAHTLMGANDTGCFVDVNDDGFISPIDALLVIEHLNRDVHAEGESPAVDVSGEAAGGKSLRLGILENHTPWPSIATTPQSWELPMIQPVRPTTLNSPRNIPAAQAPASIAVPLASAADRATNPLAQRILHEFGDWDEDEFESLLNDLAADVVVQHRDEVLVDQLFGRWR